MAIKQNLLTALRLLNPAFRAEYRLLTGDTEQCSTFSAESKGGALVANPVAVVAVPFNRYIDGQPIDESNELISVIAGRIASEESSLGKVVQFIGQREQVQSIKQAYPVSVICREFPNRNGEWVQTHVLLRWIAAEVGKWDRNNNKVIVVGHPHHARRLSILAMHYGLNPFVRAECEEVPYDSTVRPGYQWWCTSPRFYVPWEYFSRLVLAAMSLTGRLK